MKIYPEHVQYAAQYMRLDLSLPLSLFQHFSNGDLRFYTSVLSTVTVIPLNECGDITEFLQSRYIQMRKLMNTNSRQKAICICTKDTPFWTGTVNTDQNQAI